MTKNEKKQVREYAIGVVENGRNPQIHADGRVTVTADDATNGWKPVRIFAGFANEILRNLQSR
jgi:hypothetical protein